MKLSAFITELEKDRSYVGIKELGISRKGNRKLEIQQLTVWFEDDVYFEYESWFFVVVNDEGDILSKTQTS